MVGELRAYYLISGTLVKLVQEDTSSGMSQIRLEGITRDLWTRTSFLSKHPLTDPYGSIETPETSGFSVEAMGTSDSRTRSGVSPQPTLSPAPRTMAAKP